VRGKKALPVEQIRRRNQGMQLRLWSHKAKRGAQVTTYRLQSFSFHLVGLGEISSSDLFADLHTYIQTVRKKDEAQGELSSLRPRSGADDIWGIVCAFHTLLPPINNVNETETRENELRGTEAGIWSAGEENLTRLSGCDIGTTAHLTAKNRKCQDRRDHFAIT